MKVYIGADEWYPVYVPMTPYEGRETVEVPDELLREWNEARARFEDVQDRLGRYSARHRRILADMRPAFTTNRDPGDEDGG